MSERKVVPPIAKVLPYEQIGTAHDALQRNEFGVGTIAISVGARQS